MALKLKNQMISNTAPRQIEDDESTTICSTIKKDQKLNKIDFTKLQLKSSRKLMMNVNTLGNIW